MTIFQQPIICSSWNSPPFSPCGTISHTIQAFLDAPLLTFHFLGQETQRSLNYRQNGQAIIEAVDYVARVTAPLVGVGGIMPYSYLSLIKNIFSNSPGITRRWRCSSWRHHRSWTSPSSKHSTNTCGQRPKSTQLN